MRNKIVGLGMIFAVGIGLGGCNYVKEIKLPFVTEQGKRVDKGTVTVEEKVLVYPVVENPKTPFGDPIDIEVVRVGNAVKLYNRSVNSYSNVQLWLNGHYGVTLKEIPIGAGEPISLESFLNQHGERYPVRKFLRPDRDRTLVRADLYVGGQLHNLVVRLEKNWQEP